MRNIKKIKFCICKLNRWQVYYLEIYKLNGIQPNLVAYFESKQPFPSFRIDDFINYSASIQTKSEPLTGRLRVVEIEHTILQVKNGLNHKITLYTKHDRSIRF